LLPDTGPGGRISSDLFSSGTAALGHNNKNSSISLKFPYGGIGQQID